MPNKQGKSREQEKRAGQERRLRENSLLAAGIERRSSPEERRQTSIHEISYFEWASHFVKFQGSRLAEKSADLADISPTSTEPN
ncbi:MAG: hypothetical protein WAV95_05760 [Azonexus sp.]